mmetsp:Transcript_8250/g.20566  ORF Transcript_8250/g.20566 Transcript_8250/m.20566 type:complete len:215 (-) Transcript_8250:315-959(-)
MRPNSSLYPIAFTILWLISFCFSIGNLPSSGAFDGASSAASTLTISGTSAACTSAKIVSILSVGIPTSNSSTIVVYNDTSLPIPFLFASATFIAVSKHSPSVPSNAAKSAAFLAFTHAAYPVDASSARFSASSDGMLSFSRNAFSSNSNSRAASPEDDGASGPPAAARSASASLMSASSFGSVLRSWISPASADCCAPRSAAAASFCGMKTSWS